MAEKVARMDVTIVVAAARNGVIGHDGGMPWRMPSSLRRFRALTLGKPMVMGRKTFQSIGKPLDGRDTIVVTRQADIAIAGASVVPNLEAGLSTARRLAMARGVDEIIIAGGGEIYGHALPYATRVELDLIDAEPAGDTRFLELDRDDWRETTRLKIEQGAGDSHSMIAISYHRLGTPLPLPQA